MSVTHDQAAGMATAGALAKGYLLKHNRDHRSTNILPGAKYKRRWVEVTTDTMVYAASQRDALTGHIQVFAIGELVWVKPEAHTKFQVKFSERTLKFKVSSGFKEERDRWVEAFHAAKRQQEAAQQAQTSAAGKLEALQKALLGPAGTSSSGGKAHYSESGSIMLSSAGTSLDGSSVAGSSIAGSSRTSKTTQDPFLPASTSGANHDASTCRQRPLSPRSLLANARLGMALVGGMSGSPAGTPRAHTHPSVAARPASGTNAQPPQQHKPAQALLTRRHADSDTDDSEGDASLDSSAAGTADSSDSDGEDTAAATVSTPHNGDVAAGGGVGIPALKLPGDSPHAASTEDSGQATPSGRKGNLTRRVTPGVLLTSRPTTPATSTAQHQQQLSQPLTPLHQQPSTVPASPLAAAVKALALQQQEDEGEGLQMDELDSPAQQCLSVPQPPSGQPLQPLPRPASGSTPRAAAAGARAQPGMQAGDVYSSALYRPGSGSSSSRSRVGGSTSAAAAPVANIADLTVDELLALDDGDVFGTEIESSSSHQQKPSQQQHHGSHLGGPGLSAGAAFGMADSSSSSTSSGGWLPGAHKPGMLQVSPRPASASSRPGSASCSPLKSCMRNSPRSNLGGPPPFHPA